MTPVPVPDRRQSTLRVVSDKFLNVRTALLSLVMLYCCFKVYKLGTRRNEVPKLLRKIGLERYEEEFATKGYFTMDDVLLVSTTELMDDSGFESRFMASKVKVGATRARRGDFLGRSVFYIVLVFVGFSAAMCILSQNFRKAAAEICILLILIGWSFGRRQYRQFHKMEDLTPVHVEEDDTGAESADTHKKRKKIEKVMRVTKRVTQNVFSCCFPHKEHAEGDHHKED